MNQMRATLRKIEQPLHQISLAQQASQVIKVNIKLFLKCQFTYLVILILKLPNH